MAEREGFEPPVRANVQLISSQPHSTTLPPLQYALLGFCPSARAASIPYRNLLSVLFKRRGGASCSRRRTPGQAYPAARIIDARSTVEFLHSHFSGAGPQCRTSETLAGCARVAPRANGLVVTHANTVGRASLAARCCLSKQVAGALLRGRVTAFEKMTCQAELRKGEAAIGGRFQPDQGGNTFASAF